MEFVMISAWRNHHFPQASCKIDLNKRPHARGRTSDLGMNSGGPSFEKLALKHASIFPIDLHTSSYIPR